MESKSKKETSLKQEKETSLEKEELPWLIIDKYFNDNPYTLVAHHLDSYNDFFKNGINRIFREKNPIKIMKQQDPDTSEFNYTCNIYLGGKDGSKLYYGKPVIYDETREHYMFPNEARLRNMTYGITIHYDVEVEFRIRTGTSGAGTSGAGTSGAGTSGAGTSGAGTQSTAQSTEAEGFETHSLTLEKIFLGRFPIMLSSDLCILNGLDRLARFEMGECKNDRGGYFIIDGKEKCMIAQEKFADNMIYTRDKSASKGVEIYSHTAEVRSVSEDASKPVRTLAIKIVSPTSKFTNNQIVVVIPNVRAPIPLFILMRALGVESDKDIIEYCLLDLEQYSTYVDLFIPSIHDANRIFTQEVALKFIATFTKGKTVPHALEILTNYVLPHIGEMNFLDKAYFLGHMVKQLLKVYTKEVKATDRDNFKFKRLELSGNLLYDLFKEYYTLQQKNIYQKIDKEYYYKQGTYQANFISLIENNYKQYFSERIVEVGFRKAFKGNWGGSEHTKREGVVQDVNRLSFNSFISLLRKVNLPFDPSAKVVGPRLLHPSQWGLIDPVDTPDGGNVGLQKHLAISASVSSGCSGYPLIQWLRLHTQMRLLAECTPLLLARQTKVFVNGNWIGVVSKPREVLQLFKEYRRSGLLSVYTSIQWDIKETAIFIYSDAGRLCRPVFYVDPTTKTPSYNNKPVLEAIFSDKFTWEQLITGFAMKKDKGFTSKTCKVYGNVAELYDATDLKELKKTQAIIEYLDTAETESALIAITADQVIDQKKPYTHLEIHPSLILSVMGNQIVFPENNQLPRDLFACGQAKQAISLYHTNFPNRFDKSGLVLNNGQIPLVKSRYLEYINHEEQPCGENVIVAIMSLNGYNVEDSILFNEASLKRGLFRTTYYSTYESKEESSSVKTSRIDSHFANVEKENVVGLKPGYDYSELDDYGLIKENTYMDDKKVLIGKVVTNLDNPDTVIDASSFPKKGQLGYVDKTFITEGETGFRIAKVRIRSERVPAIGDKFCSRCGQKGTMGLVIPEADMPFTESGIRPDIIINPHALPSRMTIGQLIETLMGKACGLYGAFGDCTAFVNKGSKHKIFGELLTQVGFHSSGTEVLYNGNTGEQLESNIYIGPTYYMRLKHMVKDKINYRALGPRTMLTRQTVQGRANDGGLRIGEMDRDALIAHGITHFLQESMLVRGDDYYMAVCNKTGTIAIYNESYNLFLSPFADGPIRFNGTLSEDLSIENVSKFGRSFSIVRVPYAFKLLIQELQAMNIQLRIITEENINQLTNMSFSDNIEKLLGRSVTIKELNTMNYNNMTMSMAGLDSSEAVKGKPTAAKVALPTFTKLTQPLFLKWQLPATADLTLVPISQLDGTSNMPEATAEAPWREMTERLNNAKSLLDQIPSKDYQVLNQTLDLYRNLRATMSKKYNMFDATNASLKMYEMLMQLNLVDCANLEDNRLNSFSNAELPGAFIIAINYYMKSKCQGKAFNWLASSYLPAAAAATGNDTILEDKLKLYAMNRDRWLMGPRPNALPEGLDDITGDVMDPITVISLGIAVKARFANTLGAKLYTSDAGIDVTANYAGQEENTSAINFGQIISGLLTLAPGGNFITKQYTFFTPFSRSLIALITAFFTETYITKPATSRPGNSEIYLVGKGFKGLSEEMAEALTERSELFKTLGVNPTTLGSLVTSDVLARFDPLLYSISDELFMNIQIKFINEYVDVFKTYGGQMDVLAEQLGKLLEKNVKDAEANWLRENDVVPIKPDESLTWYRHNKVNKQRGNTSGKKNMIEQNPMKGGEQGYDVDSDCDNNNFPSALKTENNNTPVGEFNVSKDNYFVEEEQKAWDAATNTSADANTNTTLDETPAADSNAITEVLETATATATASASPVTKVGGGELASESSLLAFKEDVINVDTETKEGVSGDKKTITMTQS
jgi:DNA-directed RNA polymerase II subunit RPB2